MYVYMYIYIQPHTPCTLKQGDIVRAALGVGGCRNLDL